MEFQISKEKLAGICGVLAPIITLSLIGASILSHPGFSLTQHELSKLGATPGLPSILFNGALIAGGLLLLPFSFKIHRVIRKGKFIGFLFSLISINLMLIGFFVQGHQFHLPLALSFFSLLPLILISLGVLSLKKDAYTVGELELLSGVAIIVIWLYPWAGKAIPELFVAIICSIWIMDKGTEFLRN